MLKINGLNIFFKHDKDEWGFTVKEVAGREVTTPYKGVTHCVVEKDGEVISEASAFCSSLDKFEKSKGRKLALARAIKGFEKETRTVIWDLYRSTVKSL